MFTTFFSDINNNHGTNRLQPNKKQVDILQEFGSNKFTKLSIEKWIQFINVYSKELFDNCNDKLSDQYNRAKNLAYYISNSPSGTHIVYMDGHGRLTYLLFTELLKILPSVGKCINDYKYSVIDNNSCVTEWHKLFFPHNINSIQGDVYDYINMNPKCLTYLNFCGIGGKKGIVRLCKMLNTIDFNLLLLSFSLRNIPSHHLYNICNIIKKNNYYNIGWQKNLKKNWIGHCISTGPKNSFHTYCIINQKNIYETLQYSYQSYKKRKLN